MSMIPQESKLKYSIVDAGLQRFDRVKAFTELRACLKLYKSDAKLIYAWLGEGMSASDLLKITSIYRDPDDEVVKRIDYALIYEYYRTYPNGMKEQMYWVESPMLYTPKSLNVFVYYKKHGRLKEYMEDYMLSTMKVKPQIFNDYLTQMGKLSDRPKMQDPISKERIDNPNYWKREENSSRVIKLLTEMSVLYREKM